MLFADTTHEQVGLWLAIAYGTLFGILTLAWLSRQLYLSFNPPVKVREGQEEYVTRHELAQAMAALEVAIKGFVTRTEYDLRHADLSERVKTMEAYLHERMHDILNGQNIVANNVRALSELLNREIGRREGFRGKEAGKPQEEP